MNKVLSLILSILLVVCVIFCLIDPVVSSHTPFILFAYLYYYAAFSVLVIGGYTVFRSSQELGNIRARDLFLLLVGVTGIPFWYGISVSTQSSGPFNLAILAAIAEISIYGGIVGAIIGLRIALLRMKAGVKDIFNVAVVLVMILVVIISSALIVFGGIQARAQFARSSSGGVFIRDLFGLGIVPLSFAETLNGLAPAVSYKTGEQGCGEEDAYAPSPIISLGGEEKWLVKEGDWVGVWVQRRYSRVFDAYWYLYKGKEGRIIQRTHDEVSFESAPSGYEVIFSRQGKTGRYHGVLSCDRKRVVLGKADWLSDGVGWSGQRFKSYDKEYADLEKTVDLNVGLGIEMRRNNDIADQASWNSFHSGRGYLHSGTDDWHWTATIKLPFSAVITGITVLHNSSFPAEGWTTEKKITDRKLFPLVVFYKGRQLNTDYGQNLGQYDPGVYVFELFAQKEVCCFQGAAIQVTLSDGRQLTCHIPNDSSCANWISALELDQWALASKELSDNISAGHIQPSLDGTIVGLKYDEASRFDLAGPWGQFRPGKGLFGARGEASDFHWVLTLNLPATKKIDRMTIIDSYKYYGWATSYADTFPRTPYPLVVFYQGKQINTAYHQLLGEYRQGVHTFDLYGQRERPYESFSGGKILVGFDDGSTAVAVAFPVASGVSLDAGQARVMPGLGINTDQDSDKWSLTLEIDLKDANVTNIIVYDPTIYDFWTAQWVDSFGMFQQSLEVSENGNPVKKAGSYYILDGFSSGKHVFELCGRSENRDKLARFKVLVFFNSGEVLEAVWQDSPNVEVRAEVERAISSGDSEVSYSVSNSAAPANVTAMALPGMSIIITWEDRTVGEDGFKILGSTSAEGDFLDYGYYPANSTSAVLNSLEHPAGIKELTRYYFKVLAFRSTAPNYSYESSIASVMTLQE
ncbi:MAG: hypothetical protein HQL20_02745 [Candidatus Omnitrophica bacterium]|nr:hypothetical protein [Candidatus Omnitrophota bacterium]